jgi:hypothetical protein
MGDEANLTQAQLVSAYRQARRDFIAACEHAGADAIARVHPQKGPDGKPLFCDSAAFGPLHPSRALLLLAGAQGAVTAFLRGGFKLPEDAKLLAIVALDPYARAWGKPGSPADWPQKTLTAIAAEDLRRLKKLTALDMSGGVTEAALAAVLPGVTITFRAIKPEHAQQAILAAIAAL